MNKVWKKVLAYAVVAGLVFGNIQGYRGYKESSSVVEAAAGTVEELTAQTFQTNVLEKKGNYILDFSVTWCVPCKEMVPILESMAQKYVGKVSFGSLDGDLYGSIRNDYGVTAYPTFLFFKDGKLLGKVVGKISSAKFENYILQYFGTMESEETSEAAPTATPQIVENISVNKAVIAKAIKSTKTKIKISIKKVKNADGYKIVYADNKKFSGKKVILTKSCRKTIKNLKAGSAYYIKVCAYEKDSSGKKIYGSYSKVKKVK